MQRKNFFNFQGPILITDLAKKIDCSIKEKDLKKASSTMINDVKNIEDATDSDISFVSNKKYFNLIEKTIAAACIVPKAFHIEPSSDTILLESEDPYFSYCKALSLLFNEIESSSTKQISEKAGISSSASLGFGVIIEDNVEIAENVTIGHNAIIKQGVKIGKNTKIGDGSYISHCTIGENTIIHPGVKIGTDGFGFATNKGIHHKILHIGSVRVGNNVEIGANSTIDRGSNKDTIIGDGTVIDNLVQIGHNVEIGKGCIIVAQVGIAGSTKLSDYVVVGGQAGIAGHLNIAKMVQIAGKSGVISDIKEEGQIVGGYPSQPIRDWHKQTILLRKMLKDE